MQGITVAEFAKIKGVSPTAVHKAIAAGRLVNCLIYDPKYKKPRINPVVAAQEWERNTDHNKRHVGADVRPAAPAAEPFEKSPGGPVAPTAKQIIENYKARLLKLEHDEKAGLLVNAQDVKAGWYKLVTETKTKLLSMPAKAKAALPHLKATDVAVLDRLIREALEDLANGNG